MKIFKIILFCILGLVLLLASVIFIFIKTFDANKYLPEITAQISQVIHRKVAIERVNLGISFTKGLSFQLVSLIIGDDPQFNKDNFLTIGSIDAGLDLRVLLFERRVFVKSLIIDSPKVIIIRSQNGQINAQTLASAPAQENTQSTGSVLKKDSSSTPSSTASLPEISIKSILIRKGQFLFNDQSVQMPLSILIEDIEGKITGFFLTKPFDFTLALNVLGKAKKNIDITGRCVLDLTRNAVNISALNIKSDLNQWDWIKVRNITSVLKNSPVWPQEIKGEVLINIPELNFSSMGLEKGSLELNVTNGFLNLKELLNPVKNINLKLVSNFNDLTLNSFKANIGAGEINALGTIKSITSVPTYDFQLDIKGVRVEELLDESSWPAVFKGSLIGQFAVIGKGFEPEIMFKNLQGTGNFRLLDAKIEKLNLLKAILDKLNFIPGLSSQIESGLSGKVKEKLNKDTTILDKAEAKVKIKDEVVVIDNIDIQSNIFSILAHGTAGLDSSVDVNVNTYIAPDISADLIQSINTLQGLMDDQRRLFIPGKLIGKGAEVTYRPQIDYITKKTLVAEGSEQLEKILDKNPGVKSILNAVLGGGENQNSPSEGQTAIPDNQAPPEEKSSKKLINDVLNKILR